MSYQGESPAQFVATPAVQSQLHYNPSTPPPPPPKPTSGPDGLDNGRGTPLRGPPLPLPPSNQDDSAVHGTNGQNRQYGQEDVSRPEIAPPGPGWLPSVVYDLSTQDLRELVENQALQTALLNNPDTTHPSIPASQEPLRQLLESNIALASSLQKTEARLVHQRAETQSRLLALRALEQQHKSKIVETEDALRNFSPMALYQRLNASVQEQEALVKGIEESFLDEGGVSTDRELADFIRRVREAKKLAFLRAQRKERWDEGRVGGWR